MLTICIFSYNNKKKVKETQDVSEKGCTFA